METPYPSIVDNRLWSIFKHVDAALSPDPLDSRIHNFDDPVTKANLVIRAYAEAAKHHGIPGRPPRPQSEVWGAELMEAAGNLAEWALRNIQIPWSFADVELAWQEVQIAYDVAIGDGIELSVPLKEFESAESACEALRRELASKLPDGPAKDRKIQAARVGPELRSLTAKEKKGLSDWAAKAMLAPNMKSGRATLWQPFFADRLCKAVRGLSHVSYLVMASYWKRGYNGENYRAIVDSLRAVRRKADAFDRRVPQRKTGEKDWHRIESVPHADRAAILGTLSGIEFHMDEARAKIAERENPKALPALAKVIRINEDRDQFACNLFLADPTKAWFNIAKETDRHAEENKLDWAAFGAKTIKSNTDKRGIESAVQKAVKRYAKKQQINLPKKRTSMTVR